MPTVLQQLGHALFENSAKDRRTLNKHKNTRFFAFLMAAEGVKEFFKRGDIANTVTERTTEAVFYAFAFVQWLKNVSGQSLSSLRGWVLCGIVVE